jgi:hypothetical protein
MNPRVRKTQRFARVRTLQHNRAALAAHREASQVDALEASIGKLVSLRDAMRPAEGIISGATLASTGEIAMRLDQARASVAAPAVSARQRAAACHEARMMARRLQESADRLTEKATKAAERQAERKQMANASPRKRNQE